MTLSTFDTKILGYVCNTYMETLFNPKYVWNSVGLHAEMLFSIDVWNVLKSADLLSYLCIYLLDTMTILALKTVNLSLFHLIDVYLLVFCGDFSCVCSYCMSVPRHNCKWGFSLNVFSVDLNNILTLCLLNAKWKTISKII